LTYRSCKRWNSQIEHSTAGTITRISEFNAEERRKIMKTLLDWHILIEKKIEALKQLDEQTDDLKLHLLEWMR